MPPSLGLGCAVGQGWYFGKPMPASRRASCSLAPSANQPAPSAARNAVNG